MSSCKLAHSFASPKPANANLTFPTLIKLVRSPGEYNCIHQIRNFLDNSKVPLRLLSQNNEADEGNTVALVYINASLASKLNSLDCVFQVTALPLLMKLGPIARSMSALSSMSPPMEVVLGDGVSEELQLPRFNSGLQNITGIVNILQTSPSNTIYLRPLSNFKTWINVIIWLCEQQEVFYLTIYGALSSQSMSWDTGSRRLDNGLASVVGIDEVQKQGILGNGVVVGITDSGLYLDHDQFDQSGPREFNRINLNARKIVLYHVFGDKVDQSETVTCGHGTHVSGLLAGDSYSSKSFHVGIAPNAKIAFADIGTQDPQCANIEGIKCPVNLATPSNVKELLEPQFKAGARIFSFSWGLPGDDYSRQARDLDQFVYENPETLIVIAAGNSGEEGARSITSPAGAKNVITVGASLNSFESLSKSFDCPNVINARTVAAFSSQGPTGDGRLKPDLVAPGQILISAQSEASNSVAKSEKMCHLQGTSQATPVVAGLAVLIHEWLRDGWWKAGVMDKSFGMPRIPAALVKALLIHSSRGLNRRLQNMKGLITCEYVEQQAAHLQYPDMNQGYGLPNFTNLAFFGPRKHAMVSFLPNTTLNDSPSLTHKAVHVHVFEVHPNETLRVTLVWSDPSGSLYAMKMLQNDLDLSVTIPNCSKVFYPLSGSGGASRDALNNVEMVEVSYDNLTHFIPNATISSSIRVEARVTGSSVLASPSQPYALVASSELSSTLKIPGVASPPTHPPRATTDMNPYTATDLEMPFEWKTWMTIVIAVLGGVVLAFVIFAVMRKKDVNEIDSSYVQAAGTPRSDEGLNVLISLS
ncbi:hypothetical protein AeRB84_009451 [Aphanomyces euteiches]|nr:hypothetical protein AeRB84_009451 [Aphanomyces euteiches]